MSDKERQQWDDLHKALVALWEEIVKALYLREIVDRLESLLERYAPFL